MSKNRFKTTNKLTFTKSDICPVPGFASFVIGGVAGYFRAMELTVDFIFIEITIGEHLVDALEYFNELAIQMNVPGMRVMSCNDPALISILVDHHKFTNIGGSQLMKYTTKK